MSQEMTRRALFVSMLGVVFLPGGPLHTQQPVTHALLIGVTNYPGLAERFQLTGPSNDVELMRKTLVEEPFRVDAARIRVLTEQPAGAAKAKAAPAAADTRPTKANIQREFTRLADPKVVNKGDQVFILFAGHGSQQPDDGKDEEDDGWDEIFLPADTGKWSGDKGGGVVNAISDDEIAQWLAAIRNRGAFVSVVFDACQSTSMTRGNDVEVQRLVPPSALGIPANSVNKTGTRGASGEKGVVGLGSDAGDIAALYAAQTIEPTPEKPLPADATSKDAKVHGLFTYTLVSVLGQAKGQLTYRDLVERIIHQYKAMGRIGPTPGFEGGGLDREVLGQKNFAGVTRIVLGDRTPDGKGVQVRAGEVHGLTKGTVLRVFAPNPPNDRPVGHVQLTKVDATSAVAEPHEYGGMKAPDPKLLVPGSRGEVAFYDYGNEVFKVAFHAEAGAPVSPDLRKRIEEALSALEKETNGRAARAASVREANWLVRVNGSGDVVVAPVSGWRIDPAKKKNDQAQAPFLVTKSASDAITQELARVLTALARAQNLLRLAVAPESQAGDVAIQLELVRYKDKADSAGSVVSDDDGERTLQIGDLVAFRVKNTGATAADVTLLFIDADYGIAPIFPRQGSEADARVPINEERRTHRIPVTEPTGPEQILAIAVAATELRQDFRGLAQPALHRVVERSGTSDKPRAISDSPLGRLLKGVVQGQGATRGMGDGEIGAYVMKMLTWRTVKGESNP